MKSVTTAERIRDLEEILKVKDAYINELLSIEKDMVKLIGKYKKRLIEYERRYGGLDDVN